MRVKYAKDIIKEIQARGSIQVPEGYITGEAFEEWLEGKESFGMSISEQVKELRETAELFDKIDDGRRMLLQADDTIEALSAKLEVANMERSDRHYGYGWIADRVPDESGYYLVTYHEWSNGDFLPKFNDIYVKRLHYQKSERFTGWNFPKRVDERAENDTNREVLSWQPLPEPYRP